MWPAGAPPAPIHISQLYHAGVYEQIQAAIARVAAGLQAAEQVMEAGERPAVIPPVPATIFEAAATQPAWARECVWDTGDVNDCRLQTAPAVLA
ncbi:hypothetical protein AB1Y20_007652 [Prymnesium parvum]|uniref:Uncharacterized protein n=1 Tax=Prymnesium parvum TaxID=97485 RepID=A0AB34IY56_PRYPA